MTYIRHEHIHNGYRYLWLMTEGGEGHCNVYHFGGTDYGVLSHLSVEPEHRKSGIGTALQIERERILREEWGINEAWLWCKKDSWQQSWYERRGYVYHSEYKEEEDCVWMKKDLA